MGDSLVLRGLQLSSRQKRTGDMYDKPDEELTNYERHNMNAAHIRKLALIAERASVSDHLIIARRTCRFYCEGLDLIRQERQAMRRKARKLRQYEPFTKHTADRLEKKAGSHKAALYELYVQGLVYEGRAITLQSEHITQALGFDRLCDLLNINPVHRAEALQDGGATLHDLVFLSCLEDSAAPSPVQWGSGGPMYRACLHAMLEFIRATPLEALPDPFAQGELFGPKLPPKLRVV